MLQQNKNEAAHFFACARCTEVERHINTSHPKKRKKLGFALGPIRSREKGEEGGDIE